MTLRRPDLFDPWSFSTTVLKAGLDNELKLRGEIGQWRQRRICVSGVNFSKKNKNIFSGMISTDISSSLIFLFLFLDLLKFLAHLQPKHAQNTDLECIHAVKSWVKNVANYALLGCKNFGLKIWRCKIGVKYHLCCDSSFEIKLRCQAFGAHHIIG